ncbi:PREDICTED: peritrophin-1-like [Priapulus caudatus]|uniref:Peritrophin-1-like n=1 Tax=Priapulus caudatus TaxID=37621 RepID=A0ABM1E8L2_PRICU|nr:PREDICTED: peritrophin-1-like [Priapulus caudatus]
MTSKMNMIAIVVAVLCALFYTGCSSPLEKRLGVPLSAEDDCNPNIGAKNFSADASDCQIFYICDHGWPKIKICPADTIWTPAIERCEDKYDAVNRECNYIAPPRPQVTEVPAFIVDPDEMIGGFCADKMIGGFPADEMIGGFCADKMIGGFHAGKHREDVFVKEQTVFWHDLSCDFDAWEATSGGILG